MRMRVFIWAAVLVGGFYYLTSVAHWNPGRALLPLQQAQRLWTAPATAQSADGVAATDAVARPDEQSEAA